MDKKILTLGLILFGGYFAYQSIPRRSTERFYQLPSGQLVSVSEVNTVLPNLGYIKTAYGWIPLSILEQFQERSNTGGINIESFANNIDSIWNSYQDFLDAWQDVFGNNSEDIIVGNPIDNFDDFA